MKREKVGEGIYEVGNKRGKPKFDKLDPNP